MRVAWGIVKRGKKLRKERGKKKRNSYISDMNTSGFSLIMLGWT